MKTLFGAVLSAVVFAGQVFAVEHTEITKAARIPFLRGMGFDGYYQNRNGSFMTDPQLYKRLAAKGFDHIRLPINFIEHSTYDSANDVVTLKETGSWGRPAFSTFDKVIDYAEAAGLYIYLDFHGLDKFPVESETNRKQYIAAWKAVAERYKNRSNKLIFELWNEPHWELSAPPVCEVEKAVIKEIRKTNPTRLILFDAPGGGGSWTLTAGAVPPMFHLIDLPENDNNIAIVVHEYTPIRFSHQGETWAEGYSTEAIGLDEQYCTGTNDNGVAQYSTPRKELLKDLRHPQAWADWSEVPLIINEFNISTALVGQNNFHYEDITEYMSIITRFCESNNIPWTPWCYRTSYGGTSGMDCYDTSNNILPFIEPGLFPDLTPTDKFRTNMYSKAVDITFSGYTGSSALANFPVLVKLSEDTISGFRYSDFARKDGFDLCFTDSSGNLIPHEIDVWDTNGVSKVWVKVPSLTASTKIVARYGCTTNPIVPKVESVWDSDYVGVWHLGERKLPLADSSNESRDVTSRDGDGIAFGAAGVVGGSVGFGAAGSSRCVNMDDHRLLDGFTNVTIEAWTKQDAHSTNAGIVSKRVGKGDQISYYMFDNGSGTVMKYSANGSSTAESGVTLQPELGRWNHQAYSLDATKTSSNSKGYLNGALKGTGSVSLSGGKIYAGTGELHVGNLHSGNAANFPGSIDEVRISKCVRSADWIKASYDTVAKDTFATYKLQGASAQDPTLYVVVDGGATNMLDASEVKTWTTRIVKNGEGMVVAAPVSSTSITNMTVLCGAVKLASSAPASVVSKIGEHAFASGTGLDLSGKSYSIANLKGAPSVQNAATFAVTGSWTVDGAETMPVSGALVLTGASVVVPDESVFADVGHSGFPIATATGGITGVPSFASDDFALKLSADGKSLLLYYIAADTPDWTTFAKSVTVTFAGYSGTSQLTDFPVLVRLSPSISGFSYADFLKPNGGDLRFSDADGNLIPHDIDTWNPDGESTVWVKVPAFAKDGTVKAYYGCANPVKALSAKDVWDDDYVGVWHLGESALPLKESSETSVDFTSQTSQSGKSVGFAAGGIVGGSVDFKNLGYNAIVAPKTDKLDGFDKFTIEAWTFQKGLKSKTMGILSKRQMYNFEAAYYIQESANSTNMVLYVGTNRVTSALWSAGCSAPTGAWNHVAYSIDMTTSSQNARSFVNGVRKSRNNIAFRDTMPRTDSVLVIGNTDRQGWDGVFNGRVDEVRISKADRSDDWLKATYETVAKPDFATYEVGGATPPGPGPQPVEYGPLAVSDYAKSMNVTFAGAPSDATLADFPVLVKLSTAIYGFSYADFSRPNGGDLRFADASGNLLPHEIDTWNENGVSAVWVKVPQLAKDTAITAHYGYTGSGDPAEVDPKDVWDSNYVGVWHLGESALPMAESTGVSTPFASKTGTASYGAAGAVGGSVDFKAAKGTESFLTAADDDDLDGFNDFTVEMWTCQDTFYNANEAYAGTLVKRNARADNESWFTYQDKATRKPGIAYGNDAAASDRTLALANTLPAAGEWTHQSFVRTVSTSKVVAFMDGTNNSTTVKSSGAVFAGSAPLMLGGGGGQMSFPGRIDEVRISKVARSAAWVKATHDTVADANFATYEVQGVTPPDPQPVFAHEVDVTFSGYSGGSALTDFPVLVRLSPNIAGFNYADFTMPNGGDLRFYDESGSILSHEIDTWNESGVSTVWVKVPTLTATTKITAKYGSTATLPAVSAKEVWDDDYVGVWHLGESALPLKESSETSSNFTTAYGSTIEYAADGAVGGSVGFPIGGQYNSLVAPDHDALDGFSQFTIETWTYQTQHKNNAGVLAKRAGFAKETAYYLFDVIGSSTSTMPLCVATNKNAGVDWAYHQVQTIGAWNHLAYTVDMTKTTSNICGAKNGNMSTWKASKDFHGPMANCASDLILGNMYANHKDYSFNGRIDEVRISKVIRSAAWIKATYETVMKPDFARYEVQGAAALTGYAAWMNAKELVGTPDEKSVNGIENGIRYAFDIAPEKGPDAIGTPIIQVVRDANGNPSVQSRDFATGRDDIVFGILATENLTDWTSATLVPMEKFGDGYWKPSASKTSGYAYPAKMFFRYTIDVK